MSRRLVVTLVVIYRVQLPWCEASQNPCITQRGTLYCLAPSAYGNGFVSPEPFRFRRWRAHPVNRGWFRWPSLASYIDLEKLDPSLKIPVRAKNLKPLVLSSLNAGETLGARKLFPASTYQYFSFSSVDSVKLNKIPILFNVCDPSNGQGGPIATSNRLDPKINQDVFLQMYGITNRIHVLWRW